MELKDGHLYSDGKILYHSVKSEEGSVLDWELYRFNVVGGVPIKPIIADSIAGYQKSKEGEWYALKVGNANTKRMVLEPYAAFESEILPKLQHVANSIEEWRAGNQ